MQPLTIAISSNNSIILNHHESISFANNIIDSFITQRVRGNLKSIDVETKRAQVAHDPPLHNISKDCLDDKLISTDN